MSGQHRGAMGSGYAMSTTELRVFNDALTDAEKGALATRFAAADDALEEALALVAERRRADREKLEGLRAEKRAIREAMRSGVERRTVVCTWHARNGERVLTRDDTGEVVDISAQRVLG